MAAKEEKKDKEKVDGVITAVYKVNLHCPQCARKIKRPLLRTQGVQSVDVDIEKAEIKVKGVIDVIKIHKLIEKLSKKKVELISPQVKINGSAATEKKPKEIKEPIIRTTTVKVHLHCDKCEQDLRKKLLKHRGVFSVKSDVKAQTMTIQGTIESDKLLSYLKKKVHKHAEIIISKSDKKEETKEKDKKEETKEKDKKEETKEKDNKEEKKEKDNKEEKKEKEVEAKSKIIEFKEEVKVEVKTKEGNVPYFIHYVYAPQLFSDENPNACTVM